MSIFVKEIRIIDNDTFEPSIKLIFVDSIAAFNLPLQLIPQGRLPRSDKANDKKVIRLIP